MGDSGVLWVDCWRLDCVCKYLERLSEKRSDPENDVQYSHDMSSKAKGKNGKERVDLCDR